MTIFSFWFAGAELPRLHAAGNSGRGQQVNPKPPRLRGSEKHFPLRLAKGKLLFCGGLTAALRRNRNTVALKVGKLHGKRKPVKIV
jgi:hypothetical protein